MTGMPFNVDDPWTAADTLAELCDCGGSGSGDPSNPDFHASDCAGLPAEPPA